MKKCFLLGGQTGNGESKQESASFFSTFLTFYMFIFSKYLRICFCFFVVIKICHALFCKALLLNLHKKGFGIIGISYLDIFKWLIVNNLCLDPLHIE